MRYLLDTGILLRLPERTDPLNAPIRDALRLLFRAGHGFVTSSQNVAEFWNVCTRPATARGGMGLTIHETQRRLRLLERYIDILKEPASAYGQWKKLVVNFHVEGRQVHDARLAAFMKAYRVRRILTLNAVDFQRYPGVEAVTPDDVMRSPAAHSATRT